jgi:ABC-type transport system involved in cytochrome c biogenesis permease component
VFSFPLIERELRVQARRRGTYDTRLGWGLGIVAAVGLFVFNFPSQSVNGRNLFALIHFCAAVMLLVVAPLGAIDAISRERRDGTLGLLMLTPLAPAQIVLGKLAAHFIRLFYFALILMPFMVIPMLMGGVAGSDLVLSLSVLFGIAMGGIAAGLFASSALLGLGAGLTLGMLGTFFVVWLNSAMVTNFLYSFFGVQRIGGGDELFVRLAVFGPGLFLLPLTAHDVSSFLLRGASFELYTTCGIVVFSMLPLLLSVAYSARKVAQHGKCAVETKRAAAVRKQFFTPILWKNRLRSTMARKLHGNPLIWLEYRSAGRRAARWAMILIIVGIESLLAVWLPNLEDFLTLHAYMVFCFVAILLFKSCLSFQEEKETGAFELLLVTPLTEERLLSARLRAVANYYRVAAWILLGCGVLGLSWAQPSSNYDYSDANEVSAAVNFASLCAAIFSVPVCGLFFSLQRRTVLAALGCTAGLTVFLPIALWYAVSGMLWMAHSRGEPDFAILLYNNLGQIWRPLLLLVALYHALISKRCYEATLSFLRERRFVSGG